MASFTPGPNYGTPFGKNEFLRSTQDVKTESYTCASEPFPEQTDPTSGATFKCLQPGTVMAKLTGGTDAGKIAPFDAGGADGVEDTANIVGCAITFLPWQLNERDVAIAVTYDASVYMAQCLKVNAAQDGFEALDETTAAEMVAQPHIDIRFA